MNPDPLQGERDAELLERLRRHDRSAFAELMRRHSPAVFRYAWALTDSREQTEDQVQEVFLQLWRQRRTVETATSGSRESDASLLPWLLTVCRYTTFNSNRRLRRSRVEPLSAVDQSASVADDAASDELRFVGDEIARLSPLDRELVRLCLVEGRPYRDAATTLRVAPATARKRMQRIRARLTAARATSR
ncbi:RNA polymerase sigma factor [uncultured Amnibacterium sp.]|uniref:RNA polymerase sigma factor n=1 Tax=uncultured Amnibacterium sp. TaxID=1631851 RepID=UPI0035CAEFAA